MKFNIYNGHRYILKRFFILIILMASWVSCLFCLFITLSRNIYRHLPHASPTCVCCDCLGGKIFPHIEQENATSSRRLSLCFLRFPWSLTGLVYVLNTCVSPSYPLDMSLHFTRVERFSFTVNTWLVTRTGICFQRRSWILM